MAAMRLRTDCRRTARSGLQLLLGRRPPGHRRCRGSCDCGCPVGALYVAAAPSRRYVSSSSCTDLLLGCYLFPTALYRTRPFESVACVRRGTALSDGISGHLDERGGALRI